MHAFEAPTDVLRDYEIVYPFETRSGEHSMTMRPLPAEHNRFIEAMQRPLATLESEAMRVSDVLHAKRCFNKHELCAVTMMGWYLIDDDAHISRLSNDVDFTDVDGLVWAVLAVLRNYHALKPRLSGIAMRTYLDCVRKLASILRDHGVTVRGGDGPCVR